MCFSIHANKGSLVAVHKHDCEHSDFKFTFNCTLNARSLLQRYTLSKKSPTRTKLTAQGGNTKGIIGRGQKFANFEINISYHKTLV